ncbi:uncharacterized protein LOC62_01G000903 [Vanrija pseudolonga]|uniref:Uncharacterized protein n=1 Tax=Vanrija pseudolonga TaxID=143232 RepID=A0AAF0XZX0_9TREE|nr:hypothetical protein LOC62_01G000903 [Vanrija pseudolonga]
MSSYPGSTGLASTNTYQLVIISVIAAAILVAAVTTLLYRRHRHQQIMRNLPAGGYVVAPPPPAHRRKRRRDVGPEPVVWDALVGEEEDDEDEDSDVEVGEKEKMKADGDWLDDPEHWHPVAIALPPHESVDGTTGPGLTRIISQYEAGQRPATPALDMTLLIAMPDPSLPTPADDGAYPLLRVGAHEDGALPPLQLSTARVAVDSSSGWDALDKLCPPPPPPPPTAERGVQRVRVDGFSRTILRLPSQRP